MTRRPSLPVWLALFAAAFLAARPAHAGGNLQFLDAHNNVVNRVWDGRCYASAAFPNGIPWLLNDLGTRGSIPITLPQLQVIVDAAFETWEAVPESDIAFTYGGTTANGTAGDGDPGLPPDPGGLDGDNIVTFGDIPSGALAVTYIYALTDTFTFDATNNNFGGTDPGPDVPVGMYPAGTILDGDIVVNSSLTTWSVTGERRKDDLQATLVHEIGHFIGLCHSCVRETDRSQATMFPFAAENPQGFGQRTLTQDDIATVGTYYPAPSFATNFGAISGTVTKSGASFLGAHVWVVKADNRDIIVGTYTDVGGNYTLRGLPAGNYILRVEPVCFDDERVNAILATYTPDNVDFQAQFHGGGAVESSSPLVSVSAGTTVAGCNFALLDGATLDPFEPDDSPAQAHLIVAGGSREVHHFYPIGDVDYFRFSASAGANYRVATSNITSEHSYGIYNINSDTVLSLYDTDGVTLLQRSNDLSRVNNRLESYILFTCNKTGQYYFGVSDKTPNPDFDYTVPGGAANYDVMVMNTTNPIDYFVAQTGSDAMGDGSKPMPWATVQHAIDSVIGTVDTSIHINVAQGVYSENIVCADFVSLLGGFNPTSWMRDPAIYVSILDGNAAGSVFILADAMSVDGFTIRNGRALSGGGIFANRTSGNIRNNMFFSNVSTQTGGAGGGGVCVQNGADCFISSNTFVGNSADAGGALAYFNSAPYISGNQFRTNTASIGGALFINSPDALVSGAVIGNIFADNHAGQGGAINISDAYKDIIDGNTFVANSSIAGIGGAITMYELYSQPTISNNIFASCAAADGGAIYSYRARPTFLRNVFVGNSATNRGGAIRFEYYNNPMTHGNLFIGNEASNGGAIYYDSYAGEIVNNTIVNNNGHGIVLATIAVPAVKNNILAGNAGYGLHEVSNSCYFQNNDVYSNILGGYYDQDTMATYSTAAQINQLVVNPGGALSANIDTTPGFKPAPGGTATVVSYNPATFQSVLTSPSASFVPNSLVGLTVNPRTSQMRHFYVVSNTGTTITTWGDMTQVATAPSSFQVFDYHLSNTSQNINTGIDVTSLAIGADIDGNPRPQGTQFDIGADEYMNMAPTITAIANQTIGINGNTGALAFSIADVDSPLTSLTLTRNSSDLTLLPLANVVLAGSGANRTVTATPVTNRAGTAQITLTVGDAETTTSTTFNLMVGTALEGWRQTYFNSPTNSGNGADNANPDSDGEINFLEFAFGTDPTVSTNGVITASGGAITQRGTVTTWLQNIPNGVDFRALFGRRKDYVTAGLTYTVQFSPDLLTWQNSTATPTVVASDALIDAVTVPYPFFVNGLKARFFRVQVTSP